MSVPNYWVDMENEFESGDSGDDISDGDSRVLILHRAFLA
jgi:hypothetical protein